MTASQSRAERRTHPAVLLLAGFFVVCALFYILAAVPGTMRSQEAARTARAVYVVRSINAAAAEYRRLHPDQGYPADLASLNAMLPAGYEGVTSGQWEGYRYVYASAPPQPGGAVSHYTIRARPKKYRSDLCRSFFSDESGELHSTGEDRDATAND